MDGTKRDKFAEGAELTEFSVTMVFGIELGAYCCPYPSSPMIQRKSLLVQWHNLCTLGSTSNLYHRSLRPSQVCRAPKLAFFKRTRTSVLSVI